MNGKFINSSISQIVSVVPSNVVHNSELDFDEKTKKKVMKLTGVQQRHILEDNKSLADLYVLGTKKIFEEIDVTSIDAIVVVSQTPEYRLPTTANLLHGLLGLKKEALAFDINQGCSGYIYGLYIVSSLMEANFSFKNILFCSGEATSKIVHSQNKSTAFLFGDAATVTLVQRTQKETSSYFLLRSDGRGAKNLIVKDGGIAHPFSETSYQVNVDEDGNINTDACLYMNGAEIFNFTTEEVPPLIDDLLEFAQLSKEDIDVFCLHQANKFMLEFLAGKMEIEDKTPINIEKFGNTSSASIPLLICDKPDVCLKQKTFMAGFGVGYSMASAIIDLSNTKTHLLEMK